MVDILSSADSENRNQVGAYESYKDLNGYWKGLWCFVEEGETWYKVMVKDLESNGDAQRTLSGLGVGAMQEFRTRLWTAQWTTSRAPTSIFTLG